MVTQIFRCLTDITMGGNLSNIATAVRQGIFIPKSKFHPDQIPDLTGRVIIVTGGNTGIGKETVKQLLKKGAKVYMASRNKAKAEAAIANLKQETGSEAIFLELDLASLSSVKKAAEIFLSKERELHILFNNAGLMFCPVDLVTQDGYDMQFGTNVLGPWYFTTLLTPALLAGKETSPDGYARIIATSSCAAYLYTLNWDSFKDGPERRKMYTYTLYFQSKFADVVVTRELARRYADKGILAIAVNPGNIESELQRYMPKWQQFLSKAILYPVFNGALTQLFAGTMPEAVQYNGEFLVPWARHERCREESYDHDIGERLWKWLEQQIKENREEDLTTS
ncbi:NAD(P)-binding protein [Abortiporus biennis]|nr:NAD(P)-binding protein [Abortiporus biennis]